MLSIGLLFVLSVSLFSIIATVVSFEEKRGQRFFLSHFRNNLDKAVDNTAIFLITKLAYLGRYIIKLSWYYGIHKLLRLVLTVLIKTYDFLEAAFMRNRDRARSIKIEKRSLLQNQGHLGQVAEHKASVALTDTQKKRLLQKKLERG